MSCSLEIHVSIDLMNARWQIEQFENCEASCVFYQTRVTQEGGKRKRERETERDRTCVSWIVMRLMAVLIEQIYSSMVLFAIRTRSRRRYLRSDPSFRPSRSPQHPERDVTSCENRRRLARTHRNDKIYCRVRRPDCDASVSAPSCSRKNEINRSRSSHRYRAVTTRQRIAVTKMYRELYGRYALEFIHVSIRNSIPHCALFIFFVLTNKSSLGFSSGERRVHGSLLPIGTSPYVLVCMRKHFHDDEGRHNI